jgi:hypothetical protein
MSRATPDSCKPISSRNICRSSYFQFGDVGFGRCGDHQHFCPFVGDGGAHRLGVGVARRGAPFVDVADVEHRFVGQQVEIGHQLAVLLVQFDGAGAAALFEYGLVLEQQFDGALGILVAARRGLLLGLRQPALDGFEVFELQLGVDDSFVAHGVYRAVHMGDVAVVEAAQHVNDGVALADVAQELVAESFTFAGALHQSGNVDDVAHGRYDTPRVNQLGELRQSFVGYGHLPHLGVDCTEREVCRLCLCAAQAVEKSGFSYVGKAHDTSF